MNLEYTEHARHVLEERQIEISWIEEAVEKPDLRKNDPHDSDIERFYRRIEARERRVLRVAVNTKVAPWRVVSVFFDRAMKGRL